ncbi:MAG: azurin [Ottowia sp.]
MTKTTLRALVAASLMLTAGYASAATCEATVEGNDQMKYNTAEVVVDKSCKEFKVTLKHVGKMNKGSMGHNWVLTKTEDMKGVAADGIKAGAAGEYVKANDERIIAHTKMLGGGESDTVTIDVSKLKADGDYTFFCSFPGHSSVMKGKLKLQ